MIALLVTMPGVPPAGFFACLAGPLHHEQQTRNHNHRIPFQMHSIREAFP